MKFAYADPPYPGQAKAHYAAEAEADGRKAREVNHALLVAYLNEFDAWALSTSSSALAGILALCAPDVRVGAWVKGWCSWKPNNWPAYAWEPVVFRGARHRGRSEPTPRDWLMCNVTTNQPVHGAKPAQFCRWIIHLLGATPDDEFTDVFPGSGAFGAAWERFRGEMRYDAPAIVADVLPMEAVS